MPRDSLLRRFWFPIPGHLGIGVTARSRVEAESLAASAAAQCGWRFRASGVVEDVDARDLDQGHVVPNMGVVSNYGVWYPKMWLAPRAAGTSASPYRAGMRWLQKAGRRLSPRPAGLVHVRSGQARAAVQFVNKDGHVDRVLRVRVRALRRMAKYAVRHLLAPAAVG